MSAVFTAADLGPYKPPFESARAADPLGETVAVFRRWLYLPDPTALYAVLGAVAANRLAGDPVWLLLVGPPGSGSRSCCSRSGRCRTCIRPRRLPRRRC